MPKKDTPPSVPQFDVGKNDHTPRARRRKMQRFLKDNPQVLEEYTKRKLLSGWRPEGYDDSNESKDEPPAS
jgi:hypothetical protein